MKPFYVEEAVDGTSFICGIKDVQRAFADHSLLPRSPFSWGQLPLALFGLPASKFFPYISATYGATIISSGRWVTVHFPSKAAAEVYVNELNRRWRQVESKVWDYKEMPQSSTSK